MPFEVVLPDAVKDQLSHLPHNVRQRIACGIEIPPHPPFRKGGEGGFPFPRGNTIRRVQGTNKPIHRLRVGDYRVVYHLDLVRRQVIVLSVVRRQRLEQALRTLL